LPVLTQEPGEVLTTIRSKRRILAVLACCIAAALFIVSCSDDDTVEPTPPRGPDLKIDVDSTQFTVSWNPAYEVNKLLMVHEQDLWLIFDENGLTPPITYGETPPGAQTLMPTLPARPFRPYWYRSRRSSM